MTPGRHSCRSVTAVIVEDQLDAIEAILETPESRVDLLMDGGFY